MNAVKKENNNIFCISYFKDFINTLKQNKTALLLSFTGFFFYMLISNILTFKLFIINSHTLEFIKNHNIFISIFSIFNQLLFITGLYFYFSYFYKKDTKTKIKIFTASFIMINIMLILYLLIPLIVYFLLLAVNKTFLVKHFLIFTIFSITILSLYIYLIPYYTGKVINKAETVKTTVKTFLQMLNPKDIYSVLKNKLYFKNYIRISFIFFLFFIIFFGTAVILYINVLTAQNIIFLKIFYISLYIVLAFTYSLTLFFLFFMSDRIYKQIEKDLK